LIFLQEMLNTKYNKFFLKSLFKMEDVTINSFDQCIKRDDSVQVKSEAASSSHFFYVRY
jgi:hypothetical protein